MAPLSFGREPPGKVWLCNLGATQRMVGSLENIFKHRRVGDNHPLDSPWTQCREGTEHTYNCEKMSMVEVQGKCTWKSLSLSP